MATITSQIRARIKARLEAITPSIGIVHDRERWAAQWSDFLALMKHEDTGTLRGWTITREISPGQREAPAEALRFPVYVVRGYWGLADATSSEISFDDAVETVQDQLGADVTLGGIADHVEEPQLRVMEPRMYGSVLCHYAEIAVRVHLTKAHTLV